MSLIIGITEQRAFRVANPALNGYAAGLEAFFVPHSTDFNIVSGIGITRTANAFGTGFTTSNGSTNKVAKASAVASAGGSFSFVFTGSVQPSLACPLIYFGGESAYLWTNGNSTFGIPNGFVAGYKNGATYFDFTVPMTVPSGVFSAGVSFDQAAAQLVMSINGSTVVQSAPDARTALAGSSLLLGSETPEVSGPTIWNRVLLYNRALSSAELAALTVNPNLPFRTIR